MYTPPVTSATDRVQALLEPDEKTPAGTDAMSLRAFLVRDRVTLELGADRLHLRIEFQRIMSHFAAPPGLLVASEGQRRVEDVVAVDPDRAGPQLRGDTMRLADVARPDARRQSIDALVGAQQD